MDHQGEKPSLESTAASARRAFHLSLLAVLVPVLGVLFVWYQALKHRRMPGSRESTWSRILVALAVVDTLVAACVIAVRLTGGLSPSSPPASGWIGVVGDPEQRASVAVLEVVPGSPADEAGIRPADQILRIDGVSIGSLEELRSAVSEIGAARSVDVSRAGAEVNLTVIPRAVPKQRIGLFERLPADDPGVKPLLKACASYAVTLLLLGGTWLWSRRRVPHGNRNWAWVMAVMATFLGVSLAAQTIIHGYVDGWAPAIMIVGNLAAMLACLTVGLLGLGMPALGTGVPRTLGLGLLYGLASGLRARTLSLGAALLLPRSSASDRVGAIESFASFSLDPASTLLLLVNVILVGPLAEEILYRGLLLPLLVPAFGPIGAVLLSSLVFASTHHGYGPMMIQVFAAGLVLGWARLRSGGLAAPFLLHALINAVASAPILL